MPKKTHQDDLDNQNQAQQVGSVAKEKEMAQELATEVQRRGKEEQKEIASVSQFIKKADHELRVDDDLKAHGVTTPVQKMEEVFGDEDVVYIPWTESQVKKGLHHKIFDAARWAAELFLKIALWAHRHGMKVFFGRKIESKEMREIEKEHEHLPGSA